MALTVAAASADAMGVALATNIGSAATIEIRTGSKPATPETTVTGTLLATVTISGSFTSSGGVLTAADPASVSVVATGTAGYFRLKKSGGTAVMDGTVGTSGADMNLTTTSLVSGGTVDLGVPSITVPVA
jgi:hypothetical protein